MSPSDTFGQVNVNSQKDEPLVPFVDVSFASFSGENSMVNAKFAGLKEQVE